MQSWIVTVDMVEHRVEYTGLSVTGKAKLVIDGVNVEAPPLVLQRIGTVFRYFIGETELLLRMERKNEPLRLAVDGVYYESGEPVESDILLLTRTQANAGHPLQVKNKTGMGTLLAYVICSFVNIVLAVLHVDTYLPFGAVAPMYGVLLFDEAAVASGQRSVLVVGVVLAAVAVLLHLVLYALSRRWAAPLWIVLLLVALDTLFAVWLLRVNTSMVIDIAFHVWVLISVMGLLRTRARMRRENLEIRAFS